MSSVRPRIAAKIEELINNRYASAIDGMPLTDVYYDGLQITAESTFLHPADLYLLTLFFKQALNENEFDPVIEDVNNNSLYTAKNFQTAYQEMSAAELQELLAGNKDFQRKLQQMLLLRKPKFSVILSSMGMDSRISSHYISANFEVRADQLFISIDDSFIDSLKTATSENQLRNYENRLAQLFRALLTPAKVNLSLNRTLQGQEAANCGIHAIINKINHEHGLNLNPVLMIGALRKGIEASYDGDLSSLGNTVNALVKTEQNHKLQARPVMQKSAAAKPAALPVTSSSSSIVDQSQQLPNARYRLNFQSTQAVLKPQLLVSEPVEQKDSALPKPPTRQQAVVPVKDLLEECERVYTQAIDTIWKSGIADNLKMAAIRNLFLADNSKPQQPISAFRPIVTEFKNIIETAQRSLQAIEEIGPQTSQFSSGLKNIRDQHKTLQDTLFKSLSAPSYRR